MKIAIAVPARPGTTSGNSVTGERWRRQLESLDHDAVIVPVPAVEVEGGQPASVLIPHDADVVVALHARRCANAVRDAVEQRPARPVIVGLAGTDLYQDLPDSEDARRSLSLARHLVVLQEHGLEHLATVDPAFAAKASVVHQSVEPTGLVRNLDPAYFTVAVLAHLRAVKDPLLAARAARRLPDSSRVRVEHAGAAHSEQWRRSADAEMHANDRYVWRGALGPREAAQLLARADVLACTSLLEGGANVVSEAIALGIPVVGTDIGGNRGLLGNDHPGLVEVGDDHALGELVARLESDTEALGVLTRRSLDRQWMTDPAHERHQWHAILTHLSHP